jgi:hypothetical protein
MRAFIVLALLPVSLPHTSFACSDCDAAAAALAGKPAETPAPPEGAGIAPVVSSGPTGPDTAPKAKSAPVGRPLKGVIAKIIAPQSALLVTHEEIPGFMKAMTMLLKVDAPTLAAAEKGQAITGILIKKPDGWWLENVSPVTAP